MVRSTSKQVCGRQVPGWSRSKLLSTCRSIVGGRLALLMLLSGACISSAQAQSETAGYVIQPPIVNAIDENHVNMFTGKQQFTIPALSFGGLNFTVFSYNGGHFQLPVLMGQTYIGGYIDENYGNVGYCQTINTLFGGGYGGTYQCAVNIGNAVQAVYGQSRATFHLSGTQYTPDAFDGSMFTDNIATDGTCTWTMQDGTKIVYYGYHSGSNPVCMSWNIKRIIYPDGRIATYTYYGAMSTDWYSPILSITTNTGYMLKYNYSGTPIWGEETSVVGFSRAFETCDPAALSCTLQGSWPTATLSWQTKTASPCDGFVGVGSPCVHFMFTIQDAARRKHVFELDSRYRVITYQPPGATSPVFSYRLCSLLSNNTYGSDCNGIYAWHPTIDPPVTYAEAMWDMVSSVVRNGQAWTYFSNYGPYGDYGPIGNCSMHLFSVWYHQVRHPLNPDRLMWGYGNASPGFENCIGPTSSAMLFDGTSYRFEASVANYLTAVTTPGGIGKGYSYDWRRNIRRLTQSPTGGGTPIIQEAIYPEPGVYPCANPITCNKPIAVIDANGHDASGNVIPGHQTDLTYDPVHGGLLTETRPAAANGVRPQTRRTYVQRNAWYRSSAGVMTRDPNAVWLLATESFCQKGAASGSGCVNGNDQVVTSYDYGPDSGPNNLIVRGKAVTGYDPVTQSMKTLRTCYGHDQKGNKIWETSPKANPASCPAY